MNILLTGANGFIGQHLLLSLREAGHHIYCCVRQLPSLPIADVTYIKNDFTKSTDVQDWLPHVQNMDVVINAVGIIQETNKVSFDAIHCVAPCALFLACKQARVKQVIQISALGAEDQAITPFLNSKKAADDFLTDLNIRSIIIYPSIVYGRGGNSFELFKAWANLPIVPLIAQGSQMIQPIYIDDLAQAVVNLIQSPPEKALRVAAVGAEPINMKTFLSTIRLWLTAQTTMPSLSIPISLMQTMSKLGDFAHLSLINSDNLQMLQRGNTAPVDDFIQHTRVKPRSIQTALADMLIEQADRPQAALYFLSPLLRLSIAFVWIMTGIVSAFIFPISESYALLAKVGVTGIFAPVALFGAAVLDFVLGILTLIGYRLKWVGIAQLLVMLGYTVLISLYLPEFWWHPYGALTKNIPMAVAILIMIALDNRK
ncbi:SDR family oxidoreductase [Candidatus Albibeggiatoa sp. nov. NOAA]|uniref:SDR family oxidoreductase n=1 Tax=Candidatus Albibeggiatoa sp. nov. NOAA TaxID=3162724 RepID=UPI0033001D2D|nr:SDR family oxidoreductase [Thiotrichaceae bacterium]